MKRIRSLIWTTLLTVMLTSTALAGSISTKPGSISTKPGSISTYASAGSISTLIQTIILVAGIGK